MKLNLPQFIPTAQDRQWVNNQIETARFIRALWNAAGRKRRDSGFISLLVRCGWTNERSDGSGWESTRRWRNRNIANYLGVAVDSDDQLAKEVARAFPRLERPTVLLGMHTGITHYYKSLRPATLDFVEVHAEPIAAAFEIVAAKRWKAAAKVKRCTDLITGLGSILIRDGAHDAHSRVEVSPLNGLTPTLACLDPLRRFPIMNDKTKHLLRAIGHERGAEGALALYKLIGLKGIKNSFELDVYAATGDFSGIRRPRNLKTHLGEFREVGWKSETASLANIVANRIKIQKVHNQLTNRLRDCLLWQQVMPKESRFDAVILEWKKGRHLLIEAKTESDGSSGRTQVRHAIGQLFDYRHTYSPHFPRGDVDLAVLLPSKPSADVQSLLKSLGIEVLWFETRKLTGTVEL